MFGTWRMKPLPLLVSCPGFQLARCPGGVRLAVSALEKGDKCPLGFRTLRHGAIWCFCDLMRSFSIACALMWTHLDVWLEEALCESTGASALTFVYWLEWRFTPAEWEAVLIIWNLVLRCPLAESEYSVYKIRIKCASLCLLKLCCPVVVASCHVLGDRAQQLGV